MVKIDFVFFLKNKEYLNFYVLGCRLGDLFVYNVGCDLVEIKVFELEKFVDLFYVLYG